MIQLPKKLKLHKTGSTKVHKAPVSIHIKIYLWSFVDYQHLKKYFYDCNITLNYCFTYKISIRSNLTGYVPGIASDAHISTPFAHFEKL